MNYLDNREKFYQSEYAMQIVDKWVTGIPFFMEDENGVYDAFLFYSDNRKTSHFYGVKMLIATNVSTGEIKCLTDELDSFNVEKDFSFEMKSFSDIDEYLNLTSKLQETYINLRNCYVATHNYDRTLQDLYLNMAMRMIPKEIIEKVYRPLSPNLFIER